MEVGDAWILFCQEMRLESVSQVFVSTLCATFLDV